MTLHYRNIWLTLSWAWLLVIIILSLITIPTSVEFSVPYIDKVEHTVSYFILMFLFSQCYSQVTTRLMYAFVFICIGILLEYLQSLTVTRQFEIADMVANSSGVVLGVLLSDSGLRHIISFVDNRIKKIKF